LTDHVYRNKIIKTLLKKHFPTSLHGDILASVGLDLVPPEGVQESADEYWVRSTRRNPGFREALLQAYEHRCVVSGFRAAFGRTYFGCEAAHVKWHSHNGPDTVENGLVLEPTLHKLFDAGAWSLTDDRRVIVSAVFTGTPEAVERLRPFHGKKIRAPLSGNPEVAVEYIRWHRDPEKGGVFRNPPLP